MKVVHLSLFDRNGGACIAGYRQHQGLRLAGVDSKMYVRFRLTADRCVSEFSPPQRFGRRLMRVWRRWQSFRERKNRDGLTVFVDDRSEHGGAELQPVPEADIVNIQFPWSFVDLPSLYRKLPPGVPIVFTMHDMAPFTGGCPYAGGCRRYYDSCGHCPLLGSDRADDFSHRSWRRKRDAFSRPGGGKVLFVANSRWTEAEARKSSLLRMADIRLAHYGVDVSIFRPLDRITARNMLGIPNGAEVVAFAAASIMDERKGLRFLVEALSAMPRRPTLLTWGLGQPPDWAGGMCRHLGEITDERLLAIVYNCADVFVAPSIEEAFGQTALESIACGTPVVAFRTGGIVDIVLHESTGLLAEVGDSVGLRDCITRILEDGELRGRYGAEGERHARRSFSLEKCAARYREIYESLLQSETR